MKILVPIDDSKYSQAAARSVLRHYRPKGTQVRVLHVVEPVSLYVSADWFPHLVPRVEAIEEERSRQAEKRVQGVAGEFRKAGFSATGIVDHGDPKTVIVDQAGKWKADLIVVGSHGLKGVDRFLMGSVSEAVMRHAPCSVEVVRIPRQNRASRPKSRAMRRMTR